MDSVQYGTLANVRWALEQRHPEQKLNVLEHAFAGGIAGIVVSFVATPIELLKGRLQVQYADPATKLYSGPIDCAKQLVRNNGIAGLYKGLTGCILFRSFFWVYSDILKRYNTPHGIIPFFAGGFAATTFWCVSFPADIVKTKMMTQPDIKNPPFPTLRSCFSYIYRTVEILKEGLRGFYRGFAPCFIRSFPTNAVAIFVYETMMKLGRRITD
ncbi:hypothetical protein HK096_011315 [Nowakowskiella sp. JEL0078]|nr:hypothetical protein HK096_011315 [Nowakowskiella sp. JEL0078]